MRCAPLWLILVASHSLAAQPKNSPGIANVLESLCRLMRTGDTAALAPHLAPELRWTVGVNGVVLNRSNFLAAVASGQSIRQELDSVNEQRIGAVSVVDYVRIDHRQLGSLDFATRWRALAVFDGRDKDWRLVQHSLTWLVEPVRPIVLDSAAMQAFVGRYQIASGYIDDVHWESGHLVATASGQQQGAQLVPVSASAFSPDAVGSLIVFERDASGRVIGYVQGYPDGSIFRAPRIP